MSSIPVERVHLVFKTHLDLGFTDLAANVLRRYIDDFIPGALKLARTMREAGGEERFIWTTGSWLIHTYLEKASPSARREMEEAILAGDILWHALPFTLHSEVMDADLFRFGLSIAQKLDDRFGHKTIAAKMTDVPGHTRGIVPLLAEAGVTFLHIGVNEASTVPDVPPLFVWRDEATRSEIIVNYHGSYGEITTAPGLSHGLALTLTGDNLGPPTVESVGAKFAELRAHFPGAVVSASSLDAFARELEAIKATLPIVTDEIGDTWIHGVGSDPLKVMMYREFCRQRRDYLKQNLLNPNDRRYFDFSEALLCVAEHTWGMDVKVYLKDDLRYTGSEFEDARNEAGFQLMEQSWNEQRAYLDRAVAAIEGRRQPASGKALSWFEMMPQPAPSLVGFTPIPLDQSLQFSLPSVEIGFDPATGAINHLQAKGRDWADADHPLALLQYDAYAAEDYQRLWEQYIRNKDRKDVVEWATWDYTKPGLDVVGAKRHHLTPKLIALHHHKDSYTDSFRLTLEFADTDDEKINAVLPEVLYLTVTISRDAPTLDMMVLLLSKGANRLPEAYWLSFVPLQEQGGNWRFQKLGGWVKPDQVVKGGGRTLHAVEEQIVYTERKARFTLRTLDAPLVAPGRAELFDIPADPPDMRGGAHINLYNNKWNTNFPLWWEGDASFRFRMEFGS